MSNLRAMAVVLLVLAFAGCNRGPDESADDQGYRGDYKEGRGVALHIMNAGVDPFAVVVRVLGIGDAEPARLETTIPANETVERWYPLPDAQTYSARLSYTWNSRAGSASGGNDERVFHAGECPNVTRLSWTLRQDGNVVGVAFEGRGCTE